MDKIQESIDLLGKKVEDKITGFKGTVESISFDLYGCIQAVIKPKVNKDGDNVDGRWFDVNRLKVMSAKPVMEVPDFVTVPGPAEKTIQY